MWCVSGLAFVGFVAVRVLAMHATGQRPPAFDAQSARIFTGVYLFYVGIAFVFALTPGAQFANASEALMIGTSRLGVRSVFVWLQLRAVWRTLARSFIVIVILATTNSASGIETARMTVLGFAIILIPPAFAFHLTVASVRRRVIVRCCGGLMLALGAAVAFGVVPHAGTVMTAQAHGAWWPTVVALAIAAIGICTPPVRDPIPDLVTATRPGGALAQRILERRRKKRSTDGGVTSDWIFDLSGSWVILSGRLAAFFRIRKPLYFALGIVGWFAVGLGIGGVDRVYGREADEFVFAGALPLIMIVCLVAASVGRDLGTEIRNPLWWAGDASMRARLGVDSIASLWRFLVSAAAVLAGYGAFDHAAVAALLFALLTGLVWLSRCCGYLLFAFFPASIDQRGALAGLRIFFLFLLAIPVGITAGVLGLLQLAPVVQVAATLAIAVGQAVILIAIAARRIDGRIEAYLTA